MPFSLLKLTKLQVLALGFVVVSALTVLGVNRSLLATKTSVPVPAVASTNLVLVPVTQNKDVAAHADFTTLAINLTRLGFEPAAINVVPGNYLFSVRNMTGLGSVPLTITRKNGDKIISDTTKEGKRRWDQVVKFTLGDYVLTVADNPNWTCAISVLPPGKQ